MRGGAGGGGDDLPLRAGVAGNICVGKQHRVIYAVEIRQLPRLLRVAMRPVQCPRLHLSGLFIITVNSSDRCTADHLPPLVYYYSNLCILHYS